MDYKDCPYHFAHQHHQTPRGHVKTLYRHSYVLKSRQTLQHHCYKIFQYLLDIILHYGEDWLMNIETVTDLTLEGRTNLSQAKSKGLACTLITEAITSGKSWDDIKDLLQLKICNFDITHLYPISWRFNKGRRNLSPHTYIILKERPRDVIL